MDKPFRNVRNPAAAMLAQENQQPKSSMCAAYGCPMHGTISSSTHPGPDTHWYCRFHFGERVEDFDRITARLKQEGVHTETLAEREARFKEEVKVFNKTIHG